MIILVALFNFIVTDVIFVMVHKNAVNYLGCYISLNILLYLH